MTTAQAARVMTRWGTSRAADAIVLSIDALSPGPREVEGLLRSLAGALGTRTAPAYASSHVVETEVGVRHVGALVWEDPPWQLDLLSLARSVPPAGASICRMTRHGARLAGRADGTAAVVTAAREAAEGTRGRVVSFPGQEVATGLVPVGLLVSSTAIDLVVGLAGTVVDGMDLVDTGGWIRPRWHQDRLELLVERGAGGVLRPFEQRGLIA